VFSIQQLDKLAGAIILDRKLERDFLQNRLSALDMYNRNYALRYGEQPIYLSDEDKELILSVSAGSVPEFFAILLDLVGRKAASPAKVYLENKNYNHELAKLQGSVA